MSTRKLKWAAIISFTVSMILLLAGGAAMNRRLPPYPGQVQAQDGRLLFDKVDILAGQSAYQSHGLMDHGMVWGHGSQRGPEFSAMTLHIAALAAREQIAAREYGKGYSQLRPMERDVADLRTAREMKANRYDPGRDILTLSAAQVSALGAVESFWGRAFQEGLARYGILPGTISSASDRQAVARFFFWTAWVASAARPGSETSYTNNWPPDRAAGNVPGPAVYLWTLGGILSLFVTLGVFIFMVHHYQIWYGPSQGAALADKLIDMPLSSSQLKAAKFFLVVILLLLIQTCFGGLLAHYTVHPSLFYLQSVANFIPYSWAKSWHLQLAIFWIATTWIASSIYLAPIVGGSEPRGQGLLVELLFSALVIVALGSLFGEAAGIKGWLGDWWFWLGHQGWEYLELGRVWQALLFAGLLAWLFIVYRALARHLRRAEPGSDFSGLVRFYVLSAVLVVLFFSFGLVYGPNTHLSMADYWRWFVVHIWVESIFEFFGIGVMALLLASMGLASARSALIVGYFTATIVFLSGILGVAHHYFWYGGPSFWLALGSVFSSLEPVPLFGIVVRGLLEYKHIRAQGGDFPYRWPFYFLVASSFWNFLGAGVFGFVINLPIVNYYEHGTYLTVNHAHTALFGVYGMLSIGLLLFSWRGLVERRHWDDRLLKTAFFGLNGGLMLMAFGTLFPIGIVQAWGSYTQGLWAARDASFFERGFVRLLGNARIIPDTIIIVCGVLPLAYFLFKTYAHLKPVELREEESIWDRTGIRF
ncbi:MAG TPA: nitric-oxide reductase large subunit [Elusimicrobia bacterium]|nr:nitric-oxide reductase large subunit [Elusimicrobiota bacterium]HBT62805.1 nitric-oxide reductase large subunit [Elusimicrobiota bacterium]